MKNQEPYLQNINTGTGILGQPHTPQTLQKVVKVGTIIIKCYMNETLTWLMPLQAQGALSKHTFAAAAHQTKKSTNDQIH